MLVGKGGNLDLCAINNLIECKYIFYIMAKGLVADHVKVGTSSYFFGGHSSELLVVQVDSDFVVYVGPVGN